MRTQPDSIIRDLENHNSRLDKEAILAAAVKEELNEFFDGVRMALDPLITFGVKQVPIKHDNTGQGLPWGVFLQMATDLQHRNLTGHAARDAIALAMAVATQRQWNDWYRRILIKDLRCGVSEKTVNKVTKKHPQYQVPVFECQLAHDSTNHEDKMRGKKRVEVKLDGVRVLTVINDVHGKSIEMFSRNGKQFHNFDHIIEEIRGVLEENPAPYPLVLDGEIMSATFQDLMRQARRKKNANAKDAVLNLFDVIPLEHFKAKQWSFSQQVRSDMVSAWVEKHADKLEHVAALGWEDVDLDTEQGYSRFLEINRAAIEANFEGVMIKDPSAPYKCKRTSSWLKLKPFIEVTLEIVGYEEGTGKNAGRLGALVCAGQDDGKDIRVNVGGGYTDDERISFWNSRGSLLGNLVEVRADTVTQNQDGTYSLRFPRFKTFRGFTKGEKI
jgi:DNA ligase 1